jgi:hypothetical protein
MAAARPVQRAVIPALKSTLLKSLSFIVQMFRQTVPTKQFSQATKPFSASGADIRKQQLAIQLPTKRHTAP